MKRIILALLTVCIAFTFVHAKELNRVEEKKARALFVDYLKSVGKTPEGYAFNLKPFGKTTWLVDCYTKGLKPILPWRRV